MKLTEYHNVFFVGIGGIGMSALARYFKAKGLRIQGYDKTASPLTRALSKEGIDIHFEDSVNNISRFHKEIEHTLVVYTPAIPEDNEELKYFMNNGFEVLKRAMVLAEIANTGHSIAVGGTHGKTTTSSLIAHIFNQDQNEAWAFLGGLVKPNKTNFFQGKTETVVLEADEFDRSFHHLEPEIAIITSMDADHLDIYGTKEKIQEAFTDFAARVKPKGKVIVREDIPIKGITYGFSGQAHYNILDVRIENGTYGFVLSNKKHVDLKLTTGLPGRHNVENAAAAAAACLEFGLSADQVKRGIASFEGVWRRFDVRLKTPDHIYIDDYAHHPEEIRAFLNSVREMYPDKKITAIFQPHLYSRTKDFFRGFAEVLAMPDELILLNIYPAREKPIPGVTSTWLLDKIDLKNKQVLAKKEALAFVEEQRPELLVTMGAGDIDRLVDPLTKTLSE